MYGCWDGSKPGWKQSLSYLFLACGLIFCWQSFATAAERPNVVIVMTDDQGYGDLSCHGNPVLKTPNLDDLYRTSIRFTDYHVAPTCSPTRSAFLTGHWTNRTGVWHTIMGRCLLRANEVTLGDYFSDAGYATGMFGKWHLGDNCPYRPEDRGFQEVYRHGGGGVGQTPDYWDNAYFDGHYFHNSKPVAADGFCTDVFFSQAIRFIEEQHQQQQPFLAYIATNAPHGPMHSPPEDAAPYEDQGLELANFFGMIANVDTNVGRLRQRLRELGLEENTIFIFTTDNGTSSGHKLFNAGMRGAKGSPYDGGHRVPFFFYWPRAGFNQAKDIQQIVAHVDVVPTLLELCNVPSREDVRFDGVSLVPLLKDSSKDWPDRMLFTDSQRVKDPMKWRASAVMTDRWRLINGRELYDVDVDPQQSNDVAANFPDVVQRLRDGYDQWWADIEPSFAIDAAIYLGDQRQNPTTLTSHDWITSEMTAWNQAQIRSALKGEKNTGFWNVKVVADGDYTIRLRRWPFESNQAIRASLPPGDPVPGARAFRQAKGVAIDVDRARLKVGQQQWEATIADDAIEVVFDVSLKAGDYPLEAIFYREQDEPYGAYYVQVELN